MKFNPIKTFLFFLIPLLFISCAQSNNESKKLSPKSFIEKYPKFLETKVRPAIAWEFTSDGKFKAHSPMTSSYGIMIYGTWKSLKNGQIAISGTISRSRPKKEKEVVSLKTVEDEIDKVIDKKKSRKQQNNWFIGHDEVKYEIDKLTGEIDEEKLDKWYEGTDNIKEKIKERVTHKDKKQREKENDKA